MPASIQRHITSYLRIDNIFALLPPDCSHFAGPARQVAASDVGLSVSERPIQRAQVVGGETGSDRGDVLGAAAVLAGPATGHPASAQDCLSVCSAHGGGRAAVDDERLRVLERRLVAEQHRRMGGGNFVVDGHQWFPAHQLYGTVCRVRGVGSAQGSAIVYVARAVAGARGST